MTQEVQNTIRELIFTKDVNLLRARTHIENQQNLTIWKFQMECTSHYILDFYNKKDEELPGALAVGLAKARAFFDDRSHGILEKVFVATSDEAASPTKGQLKMHILFYQF